MRARGLWRLAALCFGAGWWCCAQTDLWLEQRWLVSLAEGETRAAANEAHTVVTPDSPDSMVVTLE